MNVSIILFVTAMFCVLDECCFCFLYSAGIRCKTNFSGKVAGKPHFFYCAYVIIVSLSNVLITDCGLNTPCGIIQFIVQ